MLIYILFFYLFRNTPSTHVTAFPIRNFTANSTLSLPVSFASLAAQSDGSIYATCNCNQRSALDIVWSCIATLFLCTWSSIHQNMPAPNEEWWRIWWRRFMSMYWALVAPELVLTWAVRQWMGARSILKEYGELQDQPKWTKTHAHFLQMGGFHLREPEAQGEQSSLLTHRKFFKLLKEKKISVRQIEERDIEDRSKADALTKIVVILQTLWFVIQCIARYAQGLALAQLEVTTLAVISCTFILCIIWWDKPFDAQQPIYLDWLPRSESPPKASPSDLQEFSPGITETVTIPPPLHLNSPVELSNPPTYRSSVIQLHELTGDIANLSNTNHSHLKISFAVAASPDELNITEVGQDNHIENHMKKRTFFQTVSGAIISVPRTISIIYHAVSDAVIEEDPSIWGRFIGVFVLWPLVYPMVALIGARNDRNPNRVGSYYSSSGYATNMLLLPAFCVALFGLVHCISWESEFPSDVERVLWRISAVTVGSLFSVFGLWTRISHANLNERITNVAILVALIVYTLARYFILVEALLSLRALPSSAFQNIEWSNFIPHM